MLEQAFPFNCIVYQIMLFPFVLLLVWSKYIVTTTKQAEKQRVLQFLRKGMVRNTCLAHETSGTDAKKK